ncbi:MAG: phospholipase D family protein [Tepidisphaerales bacterium]
MRFAFFSALIVSSLLISCDRPGVGAATGTSTGGTITAHFSPKGGCTDAIVATIGEARQTLDVQAYSFTSVPIAQAVVAACNRGVKVRVVLDKSERTDKYSSATFLKNHQVPVYIDDQHAIAHNKIVIVDGQTLITGSFNFSKKAEEENAENLLVIRGNPELLKEYMANFEKHMGHSQRYAP